MRQNLRLSATLPPTELGKNCPSTARNPTQSHPRFQLPALWLRDSCRFIQNRAGDRRASGPLGLELLASAILLLDANGEIVEWFDVASDVTERKLAECAGETQSEHSILLLF
jgi:hypothetical protein